MKHLFPLLFIFSCSMAPRWVQDKSWEGIEVVKLETHPQLSGFKLTKKNLAPTIEKRIYLKRAPYRSQASCLGLGGCMGLPVEQDCFYEFTIDSGFVRSLKHTPGCTLTKIENEKDNK